MSDDKPFPNMSALNKSWDDLGAPAPMSPEWRDIMDTMVHRGKELIDKHALSTDDITALVCWVALGLYTNSARAYEGYTDKHEALMATHHGHAIAEAAIMQAVGHDEVRYGQVGAYYSAVNLFLVAPFLMKTGEFDEEGGDE